MIISIPGIVNLPDYFFPEAVKENHLVDGEAPLSPRCQTRLSLAPAGPSSLDP